MKTEAQRSESEDRHKHIEMYKEAEKKLPAAGRPSISAGH
jgi:hypothetical protein